MAVTTDASLLIHLTPVQVLRDEHRMKRLKACLSQGIFTYPDQGRATQIFDECLKICGSADTLSEVLQAKFFAEHTPFHWVLSNLQEKSSPSPLFVKLLSVCYTLNEETQREIVDILYRNYDSRVYAAVKDKITIVHAHEACNPGFFQDVEGHPIVTAQTVRGGCPSGHSFKFCIPKFFDRLSVDEEVWFEFPSLDTDALFCLKAHLKPTPHKAGKNTLRLEFELQVIYQKYANREREETQMRSWSDVGLTFEDSAGISLGSGNLRSGPDSGWHWDRELALLPRARDASKSLGYIEGTLEELYRSMMSVNPEVTQRGELRGAISLFLRLDHYYE